MPVLFNPLEHAFVGSRGRVDEGVDYGMHGGYLSAIADGQITYSSTHPSGWPGEYTCYRIESAQGLVGAVIYYAEGVSNLLPVGTHVSGGEGICDVVPGGSIEIGLGSDNPPDSWARNHGGSYDQVNSQRAGIWFNQLLALVHAPTGIVQGTPEGPQPGYNLQGVGSIVTGTLSLGQLLTLYNPSTIIRHAFYRFGQYGRQASFHAELIRATTEASHFTTTKGIN